MNWRVLGLAITFVMLAGQVLSVAAQSVPWRVVQGSDGMLYLLKDSMRYRLAPDPISNADLASFC